jgi:DNA-binding NarL/FixJ family response regulator
MPQPQSPRTRVLCVDDSADIGRMVTRFIRAQPDMESVGTLDSAEGLVNECIQRRPDILVLDLTMPGPDPLGAIRALTARLPSCRVIAYSGHDDQQTSDQVFGAGAWELVSKNGEPDGIITAIRRVAAAIDANG